MNVRARSQFFRKMRLFGGPRLNHKLSTLRHRISCVQSKVEKRDLELIAIDLDGR